MEERTNKPRVFLSHSKADIGFIQQVYEDLRRCQISPWLDSEEIRHGKPWLDAIFEDGIPTCDAVLVYFTENSLQAKMVKKEIDVGILQQLKDNGIAFLPYVSSTEVRAKLRVDIQALQVPEWSTTNYHVLLPAVVAEIWRSYLERTVSVARQVERIKRLEAELDLERLRGNQSNSIFSASEERDFEYITQALDRTARVAIEETVVTKNEEGRRQESYPVHEFDVNLSSLVPLLSTANDAHYSEYKLGERLVGYLMPNLKADERGTRGYRNITLSADLADDLLTFGLLARLPNPPPSTDGTDRSRILATMHRPYRLEFTDKMQRYRYWLRYNERYPERLQAQPISKNDESLAARSIAFNNFTLCSI